MKHQKQAIHVSCRLRSSMNNSSQAISLSTTKKIGVHLHALSVTSRGLTFMRLRFVIPPKIIAVRSFPSQGKHIAQWLKIGWCSPLPYRASRRSENQAIALMPYKKTHQTFCTCGPPPHIPFFFLCWSNIGSYMNCWKKKKWREKSGQYSRTRACDPNLGQLGHHWWLLDRWALC